jgi:hypothetical protein
MQLDGRCTQRATGSTDAAPPPLGSSGIPRVLLPLTLLPRAPRCSEHPLQARRLVAGTRGATSTTVCLAPISERWAGPGAPSCGAGEAHRASYTPQLSGNTCAATRMDSINACWEWCRPGWVLTAVAAANNFPAAALLLDFGSPSLPTCLQGTCKRGDACTYAHGVFECWLHPSRYRTQVRWLGQGGGNARRLAACAADALCSSPRDSFV